MLQHNANQNPKPERRLTPDEERVRLRMFEVRRSVAVVKLTEVARGINPEADNTRANNADAQLDTYQVNGNVINAAALFAHNKRVAEEETAQRQLATEHAARDDIETAHNPSAGLSHSNVIDAADRFQPKEVVKAVEVDSKQREFQDSSRAAVLASFDDSANKRAA